MAIIKCYECEREVSDKAQSCPGCGAPINTDIQKIIIWIIIIVASIFAGRYLYDEYVTKAEQNMGGYDSRSTLYKVN